jgi:hypothetical protein
LLDLLGAFSFYDQIVIAGRQGLNTHRKGSITVNGFVLLVQYMAGGHPVQIQNNAPLLLS